MLGIKSWNICWDIRLVSILCWFLRKSESDSSAKNAWGFTKVALAIFALTVWDFDVKCCLAGINGEKLKELIHLHLHISQLPPEKLAYAKRVSVMVEANPNTLDGFLVCPTWDWVMPINCIPSGTQFLRNFYQYQRVHSFRCSLRECCYQDMSLMRWHHRL